MTEKKIVKSINFTLEQIEFIEDNPQFKIQKFVRDKLDEYIQSRKLIKELNGT